MVGEFYAKAVGKPDIHYRVQGAGPEGRKIVIRKGYSY